MIIRQLNEPLNEDYNEPYDYDDRDSDSYQHDGYYEDDFSSEVVKGNRFDADGEDYVWYSEESDIYHMDFDNWQVWSAVHHLYDTEDGHDEMVYFVVDVDTGFIDWGPVETKEEAVEFLESKYDDYLNDEDVVDSLDPDDINYVGYYS